MAGDTIGTGETYDGGDSNVTPDQPVEAAAPDHADPGDDLDQARADQPDDATRESLDEFEPEAEPDDEGEPGTKPIQLTRPEADSDHREAADPLDDGDAAAAEARETIGREARPAEQTRTQIDGPAADAVESDTAAQPDDADEDAAEADAADAVPVTGGQAPVTDIEDAADAEPGAEDDDGSADAAGDIGRVATDGEVEAPVDAGEGTGSDVDDVDEAINGHERDTAAQGAGEEPEVDLDEMEELLKLIDIDTDLINSQRDWTDGDDGWEGARDAARSGPMSEFEEDLDADGAAAAPDNVAYPPFAPAPADANGTNGGSPDGDRTAPVVLLDRDRPVEAEPEPADEFDDALVGEHVITEGEYDDTPGAARDYPPALVDYTDALMGQGEAGEERAIEILERYELTGELPSDLVIPPQMQPGNAPDDDAYAEDRLPLF